MVHKRTVREYEDDLIYIPSSDLMIHVYMKYFNEEFDSESNDTYDNVKIYLQAVKDWTKCPKAYFSIYKLYCMDS